MIKVNALAFLFIIQFLLIFSGLTLFLFIQYRKQKQRNIFTYEEIQNLNDQDAELLVLKDLYNDLKGKFEHLKNMNVKLKETIAKLTPEAEKSREYEEIINDIEQCNKDLEMCIGSLEKENEELDKKIVSFKYDIQGLSKELLDSVKKVEFDRVVAEKNRLEIKVKNLKEQLDKKTKKNEKLDRDYLSLEKEYKALYENIEAEKKAAH